MNKKLINARRDVERLRLESGGATEADIAIWEATNTVDDLERKERQGAVHAARRAALAMDVALFAVAALVMAFSLGNIRGFALDHGIEDPIAAFIAPAVDLALVAALIGDAVLSRHQLDAGPWATRLRYVSGALTLVLNSWEAVAAADPAGIVLHAGMPILLFVLAEAASPYRRPCPPPPRPGWTRSPRRHRTRSRRPSTTRSPTLPCPPRHPRSPPWPVTALRSRRPRRTPTVDGSMPRRRRPRSSRRGRKG